MLIIQVDYPSHQDQFDHLKHNAQPGHPNKSNHLGLTTLTTHHVDRPDFPNTYITPTTRLRDLEQLLGQKCPDRQFDQFANNIVQNNNL